MDSFGNLFIYQYYSDLTVAILELINHVVHCTSVLFIVYVCCSALQRVIVIPLGLNTEESVKVVQTTLTNWSLADVSVNGLSRVDVVIHVSTATGE